MSNLHHEKRTIDQVVRMRDEDDSSDDDQMETWGQEIVPQTPSGNRMSSQRPFNFIEGPRTRRKAKPTGVRGRYVRGRYNLRSRRRNTGAKQMASKALKMVNQLKKGMEKKYRFGRTTLSPAQNNADYYDGFQYIAEGDSADDRCGREITPISLSLRWCLDLSDSTNTDGGTHRIMLIKSKVPWQDDTSLQYILDGTVGTHDMTIALYNNKYPVEAGNYKILFDRVYRPPTTQKMIYGKLFLNKNLGKCSYEASATGVQGFFVLVYIKGDNGAVLADKDMLSFDYRLTYHDN